MYLKSLVLLLSLFIFTCSGQKEAEYKDLYVLKVLVDNANKPQPNPLSACQNTMTAMQLCAATAPEFSAFTLTETIFISTISFNRYTTYTDYCNNSLNEQYKNQSDSLRECFLKCDTSYWQTRRNLNICNESLSTMVLGSFNDSGTISCKRNCSTVTNNDP